MKLKHERTVIIKKAFDPEIFEVRGHWSSIKSYNDIGQFDSDLLNY